MHEQWLTADMVLNEGYYWYWSEGYDRPEVSWVERQKNGELWCSVPRLTWQIREANGQVASDTDCGFYLPVTFPLTPAEIGSLPAVVQCKDCGGNLLFSARQFGDGLCHFCAHKQLVAISTGKPPADASAAP